MDQAPNKHCVFCDEMLRQHEHIVKESNYSFVLLSNPRLTKGHTLVIPKRHVEYPGELTSEEFMDIFALIEEVRCALLKSVATGVDVRQHYRPFLPESKTKVDHVHFHILPRTMGDELHEKSLQFESALFADLEQSERDEMTHIFLDSPLVQKKYT
jgi:diadenosine tetraphosphate (Ap4A) HIT family hydrolase